MHLEHKEGKGSSLARAPTNIPPNLNKNTLHSSTSTVDELQRLRIHCVCQSALIAMWSVLVWLAVMAATFYMSQAMCTNRNIIVQGPYTVADQRGVNLRGWIRICVNNRWRAVCEDEWDATDATVMCRQLGFSTAAHCQNSCNGGNLNKGIRTFACTGRESELLNCPRSDNTDMKCNKYAGVTCSSPHTPQNTVTTSLPCEMPPSSTTSISSQPSVEPNCTCTTNADPHLSSTRLTESTTETIATTDTETDHLTTIGRAMPTMRGRVPETTSTGLLGGMRAGLSMNQSCPSLAALGGGLGALTAILAILLVGVVIGWVWSCRRKTEKLSFQERPLRSPHLTFPNPSYTATSPTTHAPSVQYSSLGPRGTPLNHSPSAAQPTPPAIYDVINEKAPLSQPQGGEGIYHVLEGPQEEGGEGVYHVLEGPQEGSGRETGDTEELEGDYHLLGEAGRGEGLVYEVPISSAPSQPAAAQPGGEPMDTEYSKLQHQ